MRRRSPLVVLLTAVVVALGVAPASAAVTGTVTLGMVHSGTGAAATLGATQVLGARLAVEQLNAGGGLGYALALELRDDGSTGEGAKTAFAELLGAGAAALLGPTLSGSAFVADPLVQAAGRPLLAVSNTADGITEMGSYIFRASMAERVQIPAAVRAARRRTHFRRPVMIVRTDQPFAVSGARAFRSALRGVQAPLVAEESYTGSPASFRALLVRLSRRRPDVLILNTLTEGAQLMREARRLKAFRDAPVLGGNAFNSLSVIKDAGAAADGLIVGGAWHPDVANAASRAFVTRYRARYDAVPDQFAAQAYSAVLAIADALRRAGTTDPAALRDALAATSRLPTPLGRFSFDADREGTHTGVVQIVRGGRFRLLG